MQSFTTQEILRRLAGVAAVAALALPAWGHGTGSAGGGSDAGASAAAGSAGADGGAAAAGDGGAGSASDGPSAPSHETCFDRSIVAWRNTPECSTYIGSPIPAEWARDAADPRYREMPSQAVDSSASGMRSPGPREPR